MRFLFCFFVVTFVPQAEYGKWFDVVTCPPTDPNERRRD